MSGVLRLIYPGPRSVTFIQWPGNCRHFREILSLQKDWWWSWLFGPWISSLPSHPHPSAFAQPFHLQLFKNCIRLSICLQKKKNPKMQMTYSQQSTQLCKESFKSGLVICVFFFVCFFKETIPKLLQPLKEFLKKHPMAGLRDKVAHFFFKWTASCFIENLEIPRERFV